VVSGTNVRRNYGILAIGGSTSPPDAQLIEEKSLDIGLLGKVFAERGPDAVAGVTRGSQKNQVFCAAGLEPGCHLAGIQRVHAGIIVAGQK
jgi:hypothetical protein